MTSATDPSNQQFGVKPMPDDFGLMTYDPAYANTASCRSSITYIDGGKGILRHRGYPIEQLAERWRVGAAQLHRLNE